LLAVGSAGAQEAVTPAMIARGDSIFRGKIAGGTCITCHQANAKGIPGLAPDLTDQTWLHSDGSLAAIVTTIEKGVPKPKQAAAPMLPKGGGNLTPEQIRAVAAYVYSLSGKR
jgi:mono/diheme cytochrome c family protein